MTPNDGANIRSFVGNSKFWSKKMQIFSSNSVFWLENGAETHAYHQQKQGKRGGDETEPFALCADDGCEEIADDGE